MAYQTRMEMLKKKNILPNKSDKFDKIGVVTRIFFTIFFIIQNIQKNYKRLFPLILFGRPNRFYNTEVLFNLQTRSALKPYKSDLYSF
jgi:hypothetical protein